MKDVHAFARIVDPVEKTAANERADADDGSALLEKFAPFESGTRAIHPARIIAEMQRNRHLAQFSAKHIDHHRTVVDFDKIRSSFFCLLEVTPRHRPVAVAFKPAGFLKRLKTNSVERIFYR